MTNDTAPVRGRSKTFQSLDSSQPELPPFFPFALAIETVRALRSHSRYCRICGRKMGLWHVERCHTRYQLSPGLSIVIILAALTAVAVAVEMVLR
jgi:hypothetical protein